MCADEAIPAEPTSDRVGIRMDVLEDIIGDLNEDSELQQIFGIPVSRSLALVADNSDLRIEEAGRVNLSQDQSSRFLAILEQVILNNSE